MVDIHFKFEEDFWSEDCGPNIMSTKENILKYLTTGFGFNNIGKRSHNPFNIKPRKEITIKSI